MTEHRLLLLLFFAAIVAMAVAKTPHLPVQLLRAFLPSWKFFEDLGEVPVLYFRIKSAGQWTEWKKWIDPIERKWWQLIFNPQGNLNLAYGSLVQELCDEIHKSKDIEQLENSKPFQDLKNLLLERSLGMSEVQFKIVAEQAQGPSIDVLVSPEFKL